MRRSIPRRVAGVQVKLVTLASVILLLAAWWLVPGVATVALLVAALGLGLGARPLAELVVSRRRLSVAALLDPDGEGEASVERPALDERR